MAECNQVLKAQGQAYPRTCAVCGLGPCIYEVAPAVVDKVVNALSRQVMTATLECNVERAKRFAEAAACVLELFPERKTDVKPNTRG